MRLVCIAGLALAACGGNAPEVEVLPPAPSTGQPVAVVPQEATIPPVIVAPVVIIAEPPPPKAPTILFSELWEVFSPSSGIKHSALSCVGAVPRVKGVPQTSTPNGAAWSLFGSPQGTLKPEAGFLQVASQQIGGGFALLSWKEFSPTQPLKLEASINLYEDQGAWIGLTLIQDETDYRELSLRWDNGSLYIDAYAPCFIQPLGKVEPGARKLTLEYLPNEGWRYSVDGRLLWEEPLDHNQAALIGPPRVGLYIVNLEVEARLRPTGWVRAIVGPVTVTTP